MKRMFETGTLLHYQMWSRLSHILTSEVHFKPAVCLKHFFQDMSQHYGLQQNVVGNDTATVRVDTHVQKYT
jgi:hypothetical protein